MRRTLAGPKPWTQIKGGPSVSDGGIHMTSATIEMLHHQKVRYYRHELATAQNGARRTLLLRLMEDAITTARERGWSSTRD